MTSSEPELYIGLMSGTSMDGIDAVLVDYSNATQPKLVQTHSHKWPEQIQQALIEARDIPDTELSSLTSLDIATAEIFAEASLQLLTKTDYLAKDIRAIGNHGQTIRHRPDIEEPFSLQIGNAKKITKITGIDVVSDFRTADIRAGGQGAPLVPAFHQITFQNDTINRVIVNIGGIANITILPKDKSKSIIGFDCGTGNTLMDAWISQIQEFKEQRYDTDGELASRGTTNTKLLTALLADNFFQLAPPKSTGFEYFNLKWLKQYLPVELPPADVQSTLCDLTANSVINTINQYADDTDEIYICGGGVHNKQLMRRLQALTPLPVMSTKKLGIHPDWVEAMTFAWLAYRNIHQLTGNLPSVTGAQRAVILGTLTKHLNLSRL